jgi:hypothetical protein
MLLYVSADQKLFGYVLSSLGYVLLAVCSTTSLQPYQTQTPKSNRMPKALVVVEIRGAPSNNNYRKTDGHINHYPEKAT